MKTTTLPLKHSMKPSRCTLALLLVPVALACFGLAPQTHAVCQQGCDIPNGNTFLGDDALLNNTTGSGNLAIGNDALLNNTTGDQNTAVGSGALVFNTAGSTNTATGYVALELNTIGGYNTANGAYALLYNTTGNDNTAIGGQAMQNNRGGSNNTATGDAALFGNLNGNNNTASGSAALLANTNGGNNTASGASAFVSNTNGGNNTANGFQALYSNITGGRNVADGVATLLNNSTGSGNIALGWGAGGNLTTGDYNIDIGNRGVVAEANTIRIGNIGTQTNAYIAGISGATVPTGIPVIVDTTGHLGTATSSGRYKEAIKPMDNASEAILALKPVTFRYKHDLDPEGIRQFGLVAEDVEKVTPDLVARDAQGKPYSVRYEAVNAMLLNEFLKTYQTIERQEKKIEALELALKEQAAQIQKVIAQSQLSQGSTPVVVNSR